jgi:TolB-like protein/Flp pilus assembly protein TadD
MKRPVAVPLGILVVFIALAGWLASKYIPLPKKVGASRLMIAVLPFENLSGDADQEPLARGFTAEMISQLGQLNPNELGVIAEQSSTQPELSKKSVREVRQLLGVDFIVDGDWRKAGDRVRITASLIRTENQEQLWSRSYERDLRDVLALQSEVAQSIASEIQLKLAPPVRARLAAPRPVNPEAYQDYLRGRFYLNSRDVSGLQRGLGYLQQAVLRDPNFALAYVGIADSYNLLGFYSALPPNQAYPRAEDAVKKALALDPSLAEAYTALADLRLHHDFDWKAAEQDFLRAIQLNPNYSVAHHWYGALLTLSGRPAESLVEMKHALELDPVSLAINGDMAMYAFYSRQYDDSVTYSKRCLELDANYHMGHFWLARALVAKKMYPEAIAEFKRTVEVQPANVFALALLGHVYAVSGQPALARKVIRDLARMSQRRYVAPTLFALVYAGLGDADRVFQYADRAYQERDPLLTRVKIDPIVDSLRSDPRFADLVRHSGLQP